MINNHSNNPRSRGKGNTKHNQIKAVLQYLEKHIATASMVSDATGIPQKNICRYKRDLEEDNLLWQVHESRCKITGFKAWYLTTDPQKAPSNNTQQLKLF